MGRDLIWWVIVGVCTAPIWGSFVWLIWEGSIRPRLIPAAEIEAEARRLLARWGDRAVEMAFIEEDGLGAIPRHSSKAVGVRCPA